MDAFFSSNSGRKEFTDVSSPNGFMSDNSLGNLNIPEIGAAENTITFYYKKPYCIGSNAKSVTLTSASSIPVLTEAIESNGSHLPTWFNVINAYQKEL